MMETILSTRDLSVRFGGVLAVNRVNFDVRRGEVFTLIGPNGAGKTTVFNLISRIYEPTTGHIRFEETRITDLPPHGIAAIGIARTFQNIELFEHATVLQNLLIGHHAHRGTGFWGELFFTAAARRSERAARLLAEEVIELLRLQRYRDSLVAGLASGLPQGGGVGPRPVHEAEAAAAGRAVLGPESRGDRRHGVVDRGHPRRAGHHGADGGTRHVAGLAGVGPRAGHEPARSAGRRHPGRGAEPPGRDPGLPGQRRRGTRAGTGKDRRMNTARPPAGAHIETHGTELAPSPRKPSSPSLT